ncbi:unnamed protein product [Bursaphelenchus okinawaensis]|uniref:choline-phosphate cytidylyltransferase n=1 Tax=Bursaphelenchus okinawaensis TaxID=465554 RepID=A0A811LE07_9BILA|nr:unnamed protein product [Bursaphelenchus okinawaensis]CAG9122137.1 unnamed protein product [Bursaphelenchus okinawaensis]
MAPVAKTISYDRNDTMVEDKMMNFKFNKEKCILSTSQEAKEKIKACGENWKPRTLSEIYEKGHDVSGPVVRILADGIYDFFHWGHANQFKQIKQLIPNSYLIVGVCRDEDTAKHKRQTVFTEEERVMTVMNCRFVDEVYKGFPYSSNFNIMEELRVDLMAHDSVPYSINQQTNDCYAPFKSVDRFLETERYPGVSTTDLINRILDRYEEYKLGKRTST